MKEIKCPNCNATIQIDESTYDKIVNQVRDKEFERRIKEREKQYENEKINAVENATLNLQMEIQKLNTIIENNNKDSQLAIVKAVQIKEKEISEKEQKIITLQGQIKSAEQDFQLKEQNIKMDYESQLKNKDEQIAQYRDFKSKQSVKLLGETLEQHCEIEFNKLRSLGFQNSYFEKDNDVSTGSKGDYIFRELDEDGNEILSIMFEMKNEADMTSTKKKNEDFLKKLDKDRNEKKCEYAVLVSMLESDNDYYNTGIVDVSYRYPKMYVVRPQFFIPTITLLRNAALKSLEYKRALIVAQNQNVDITNFENKMNEFKEGFAHNYNLASKKFQSAIKDIDDAIEHLQKIRDELLGSEKQLGLANKKVDALSIKKLTQNNPTMRAKFEALKNE